jgi:hypothetical protein
MVNARGIALVLGVILALGCQGQGAAPRVETGSSGTSAGSARFFAEQLGGYAHEQEPEGEGEGSARTKPEEPPETPEVDVGKQLVELGAISAWQAVIDRTQYLARRNQRGVAFGTLGPAIMVAGPPPASASDAGVARVDAGLVASPYAWLVDDTEGNGALAIRVLLPKGNAAKEGDRIALKGTWALDDARHWYWKVESLTALGASPPSKVKDPPAAPGHAIVNGELPSGVRPISRAQEGDLAYFTVVGAPPPVDGDGWAVADELGNPVYALLNLPGERASYGAQDLRTSDERWQLRRGWTYWVRIGEPHKHGPDKPVTINARTAPVRVK